MSLLIVDFDRGSGGEWLSKTISQSEQCHQLKSIRTNTNRTKVYDIFDQELLKLKVDWDIILSRINQVKESDKFYVAASHRNTSCAFKRMPFAKTLRVAMPYDQKFLTYIRCLDVLKTKLSAEPNKEYLIGLLKNLVNNTNNKSFLSKVRSHHDNLTITLLSRNIEPTYENRLLEIQRLLSIPRESEPEFNYDCVIRYSDLITNHDIVEEQLYNNLGIITDKKYFIPFTENFLNFQNTYNIDLSSTNFSDLAQQLHRINTTL